MRPPEAKVEQGGGGWGGSCTCPDGSVYYAGDEHNNCGSLAYYGGEPGACVQSGGNTEQRLSKSP